MSKIKLVALDMDGTLLNNDGVITNESKKVIKKAEQRGVHIVISTGRPLASCISFVKELGLSSYIITSNGAQIFTADEQLIEQQTMDGDVVKALWQIGHDRELHMWLVADDAVFVQGRRPNDFQELEWLKMGYGGLSETDKLYIMERLQDIKGLEVTNSNPTNIEVNREGVHKEQALRTLCSKLDLAMDEVMAVGDGLNDFRMIKEAGIGVAVANAQDEILDIADYVTLTNEENGVAKAIADLVLDQ